MTRVSRPCRAETGTALLVVLMLVAAAAAVFAVLSVASRTEILIAANFRQGREALYAAEGATAVAIRDLAAMSDWSAVLAGASTSTFTDGASTGERHLPGGERVTLCCGPGSLTAEVQQYARGGRDWGANTPHWQLFAWGAASRWLPPGRIHSVMYVAVWVADDPRDGDGNAMVDTNGTIELHAQALGPRGARRILEVTVRRQRIGENHAPGPGVRVISWHEARW